MRTHPAQVGSIPCAKYNSWHLSKKLSEEDLQDACPLLLGHSLSQKLLLPHLSYSEAGSAAEAQVLQQPHEATPVLFGVKHQHLGWRKASSCLALAFLIYFCFKGP